MHSYFLVVKEPGRKRPAGLAGSQGRRATAGRNRPPGRDRCNTPAIDGVLEGRKTDRAPVGCPQNPSPFVVTEQIQL